LNLSIVLLIYKLYHPFLNNIEGINAIQHLMNITDIFLRCNRKLLLKIVYFFNASAYSLCVIEEGFDVKLGNGLLINTTSYYQLP